MSFMSKLPLKNLLKKPSRTAALLLLSVFLAFSVFSGSVIVSSLRRGLNSLQARLGADVIAVPAKAKSDLEAILIQGVPGYFYMDKENVDKIAAIEGVEAVSAQYFLATLTAGCCSMPVQLIGFDPETDFSIQPWVSQSYKDTLGDFDLLAGADINAEVGDKLRFYGNDCKVVGKLDKTGTELDNAIYTNPHTIRLLLTSAAETGLTALAKNDPDDLVSSVLIKAKDGYDTQKITDDINVHLRKVRAVKTQNMISGISQSLEGVSEMISILIAAVWVLSLVIMMTAFSMIINERKKEFAVLRVIGASRGRLAGIVLCESLMIGLAGGIIGVAAGCAAVFPFSGLIETKLGLPFLIPDLGQTAVLAALAVLASVAAGPVTSAFAAIKASKVDTGLILREAN